MISIHAVVMVLIGVVVGECIIRLCRRLPAIVVDTNVYPGSTLLALAAGGLRVADRAWMDRGATLAIWAGCAAAPLDIASAVALASFLSLLLAAALVDATTHLIPDEISGLLVWGGMAAHYFGVVPWGGSLEGAAIGAALSYGLVWLFCAGYCAARRIAAIGHGDLKLLAGLGAWLMIESLPSLLLIASSLQMATQVLVLRKGAMAFGPALAIAGATVAALKLVGVTVPYLTL